MTDHDVSVRLTEALKGLSWMHQPRDGHGRWTDSGHEHVGHTMTHDEMIHAGRPSSPEYGKPRPWLVPPGGSRHHLNPPVQSGSVSDFHFSGKPGGPEHLNAMNEMAGRLSDQGFGEASRSLDHAAQVMASHRYTAARSMIDTAALHVQANGGNSAQIRAVQNLSHGLSELEGARPGRPSAGMRDFQADANTLSSEVFNSINTKDYDFWGRPKGSKSYGQRPVNSNSLIDRLSDALSQE